VRYNNKNVEPKFITRTLDQYLDIIKHCFDKGVFHKTFLEGLVKNSNHSNNSDKTVGSVVQKIVESSIIVECEPEIFKINCDIEDFLRKLFDIYVKSTSVEFNTAEIETKKYSGELSSFLMNKEYNYESLVFIIRKICDSMSSVEHLILSDVNVLNQSINNINSMEDYNDRSEGVNNLWKDFIKPSEFMFKTDGEKPIMLIHIENIKYSLNELLKKYDS